MKHRFPALLLALAMVLSGCDRENTSADVSAQTTFPQIQVLETIGAGDTYPDSGFSDTWYAPVTENGAMLLRCLVRNNTESSLALTGLTVTFLGGSTELGSITYGENLLKQFLPSADNALTLTPGDSVLVSVKDDLTRYAFEDAICTFNLTDSNQQTVSQTFYFTTDREKISAISLAWEGGWEIAERDPQNWIFSSLLNNETDATWYLEALHTVWYDDGLPVQTASFSASALHAAQAEEIRELAPGEEALYTDTHSMNYPFFDRQEMTFVYRDAQGSCHTLVRRFRIDENINRQEITPGSGVYVCEDILQLPKALGLPRYTTQEIRDMIAADLTLEELAEKITTVADMMQYFHESRYAMGNGDHSFTDNGISWHVNDSGKTSFLVNRGNTGAAANLMNCLLQGDYPEQGYYIEVTRRGGHLQGYVRVEDMYYFLDLSICMEEDIFTLNRFRLVYADSPEAYAAYRLETNHGEYTQDHNFYTVMQYLYPYNGNHRPLGVEETLTVLPEEIQEITHFLYMDNEYHPAFAPTPELSLWPKEAQ